MSATMPATISLQDCATFTKEASKIVEEIKTFTSECEAHFRQWKETVKKVQTTFKDLQLAKLSAYQRYIRLSRTIVAEKGKGPLAKDWQILEEHCHALEKACKSIDAQLESAFKALIALQEFCPSSDASDTDGDTSDDEKGLPAIDDLTSPSSNSQDSSARSSTPPSEPEEA